KLGAEQRHLDKAGILVAIADDEAVHLALQSEPGEEFGFAADFEAEIKRLAGIKDFFDDFAELVDLDGEHAAIPALIIEFRNRIAEGEVNGFDAMTQDVLETNEQGKFQIAPAGFLD